MNYFVQRRTNPGSLFTLLATDIVGQSSATSYADTKSADLGPFFYWVGVRGS